LTVIALVTLSEDSHFHLSFSRPTDGSEPWSSQPWLLLYERLIRILCQPHGYDHQQVMRFAAVCRRQLTAICACRISPRLIYLRGGDGETDVMILSQQTLRCSNTDGYAAKASTLSGVRNWGKESLPVVMRYSMP
jgi:hypothetical protein